MSMDNITGFSPDDSSKQIISFFENCSEISTDFLNKGADPFYHTLQQTWCSPKAVEFGNKYFPRLYALGKKIIYVGATICYNATTAYNSLAEANGMPTIKDYYVNVWPTDIDKINNPETDTKYQEYKEIVKQDIRFNKQIISTHTVINRLNKLVKNKLAYKENFREN